MQPVELLAHDSRGLRPKCHDGRRDPMSTTSVKVGTGLGRHQRPDRLDVAGHLLSVQGAP